MNNEKILLKELNRVGNFENVKQEFTNDQLNVIYACMDAVEFLTIPYVVGSEAELKCEHRNVILVRHAAQCKNCGIIFATMR